MNIGFRPYTSQAGITEDYFRVYDFLAEEGLRGYTYARWAWMATHSYLQRENVGRMGLWEEAGRLVAAALFDCSLDDIFLLVRPGYECLRPEMIAYAQERLASEHFALLIAEGDETFQAQAAGLGYRATPSVEREAVLFPDGGAFDNPLPEGYRCVSLAERPDFYQYLRVLYRGFDHEKNGEGPFAPSEEERAWIQTHAQSLDPHENLQLKIAVEAPDGSFAAFAGLWYDARTDFAVVEPVATDPDHRRKGLGRAAVLEGVRRVSDLGSKAVYVGSDQPFYYGLGFQPYRSYVRWVRRGR